MVLYWIIRQKYNKILTKTQKSNIPQIQSQRGHGFYTFISFAINLYLTHFPLLFAWDYNLFHMTVTVTASTTKSSHQDHGLCYLQIPIFFLYILSPLLLENKKKSVITVFQSKIDYRQLFNHNHCLNTII